MRFISTDRNLLVGNRLHPGSRALGGTRARDCVLITSQNQRTVVADVWPAVILLGGGAINNAPGVIVGGLAFGRRNWPKAVRIVLWTVAIEAPLP